MKTQILFAVIITLGAILVLPTALSAAGQPALQSLLETKTTVTSAGSVATSVQDFTTTDFGAAAYTDWER
jgi:hypothetical protein